MTLLVALAFASAIFLVMATATGHADKLQVRLPGGQRNRIPRDVWLRQAGVTVTPLQFWAVSLSAAVVMEMVCWSVGGAFMVGVVPAIAAGLGPRAYFARKRTAQLGAVVEAWPQAIRDLLSSISARRSVHHAIIELTTTGPAPMRVAFADYAALASLGGTPAALATIRHQLADPVSDRVIELLIVAHDAGQSLTLQILAEQAEEVTKDLRTAADIRSEQAETRIVASTAFVLPWAGLLVICAGVPGYRQFYRTGGGLVAILISGSISMAGLFIARRLAKEAAEPRVLGGPAL